MKLLSVALLVVAFAGATLAAPAVVVGDTTYTLAEALPEGQVSLSAGERILAMESQCTQDISWLFKKTSCTAEVVVVATDHGVEIETTPASVSRRLRTEVFFQAATLTFPALTLFFLWVAQKAHDAARVAVAAVAAVVAVVAFLIWMCAVFVTLIVSTAGLMGYSI